MFIEADTHCHTLASTHAYSTVLELAAAARDCGLKAIAVTDHAPGAPDSPHLWHFMNLSVIPRTIYGVTVLRGAELNILDFDGNVDLPLEALKKLDWTVASMHGGGTMREGTREDYTNAYLKVAENPAVNVIGHSASPAFPYDYERVIPVFRDRHKLIEVNESALAKKSGAFRENMLEILEVCRREKAPVIVNSDTHFALEIGRVPVSEALLREIDFPMELVANRAWKAIAEYSLRSHGHDDIYSW